MSTASERITQYMADYLTALLTDETRKLRDQFLESDELSQELHALALRSDADGIQTACSRECIDKIAKATGKTDLVRPV